MMIVPTDYITETEKKLVFPLRIIIFLFSVDKIQYLWYTVFIMAERDAIYQLGTKIKVELSIRLSSAEYMLWINPLIPYELKGDTMTFIAPTEHAAQTLSTQYLGRFLDVAQSLKLPVSYFSFKTENTVEGTMIYEYYRVSFIIKDNNGAFRPDLPEAEESIPLIFDVITLKGVSRINRISQIVYNK